MAENEPEMDKPDVFSPRCGMIEMLQVLSVLLIPIGWQLLLRVNWWSAGAIWILAVALFLLPFHLIRGEVKEAEATEKARAEAALRDMESKETEGVKAPPYHSSTEGTEVYHIFSDCYVGNNIEPENWTKGDGGKTLCKICEEMTRGKEKAA